MNKFLTNKRTRKSFFREQSAFFFPSLKVYSVWWGSSFFSERNSSLLVHFYFVKRVPVTPHRPGHIRDTNHIFPHKARNGPAQFYCSVPPHPRFNPVAKYGANEKASERNLTLNPLEEKDQRDNDVTQERLPEQRDAIRTNYSI